jgi:hypothetical protein
VGEAAAAQDAGIRCGWEIPLYVLIWRAYHDFGVEAQDWIADGEQ